VKRPCIPGDREAGVSTFVPLLGTGQVQRLPAGAREVIEYRKSGLSLNHIQGCPLDCAYCIRHTYGLWDQRQPRALMRVAGNAGHTGSRHQRAGRRRVRTRR
jgi:hypothetical protein